MSATWLLARRNLARNPVRLLVSVGGVALALSLTLSLDAIYAGVANQLTTYIDRSGADAWVSQPGEVLRAFVGPALARDLWPVGV